MKRALFLIFLTFFNSRCGVKQDPQPPLTPYEIGRGQPLFKMDQDRSAPAKIKKNTPAQPDFEEEPTNED